MVVKPSIKTVSAVGIRGRDGRPLVNAVEHGDRHAARQVGLHVAVEEEGARVDDFVAQREP